MSERLMKCGDFALFCGTTRNTLLHYEHQGLLLPASIDNETGYRYYSASQFNRFCSIKALADAGFPLKDISVLLSERDVRKMSGAIEEGRQRLHSKIMELEDSLARLRALQSQLYMASNVPFSEPQIVQMPEQHYINVGKSMHATVVEFAQDDEIIAANIATLAKLTALSPAAGMAPYGMISHGELAEGPVIYDSMMYLILQERDARVLKDELQVIPAGTYARVGFFGPWDDTSSAHRQLMRFVEARGGDPRATRYEISAFRLFDSSSTDGFDDYHCIVFMAL